MLIQTKVDQHLASAQRLAFRLQVKGGGIEPLQLPIPWFSRPVADHLAASSIKLCLVRLVDA
ncbi:hypothetical protein I8748_06140 [Nostoc sp. CENA67]|uniref:Uncharacterized protein n=1 Tax=Amazonocrinis nigriterrae CENA67 TaxID=2794033 RepID=A0A8J7HSR0_9NOST|nr:hypothetical protein [Amazonocrinis nigriterrae]MBH8561759.1 hypothetical protein [Amazonocrinis nigriterrae CENA67]